MFCPKCFFLEGNVFIPTKNVFVHYNFTILALHLSRKKLVYIVALVCNWFVLFKPIANIEKSRSFRPYIYCYFSNLILQLTQTYTTNVLWTIIIVDWS